MDKEKGGGGDLGTGERGGIDEGEQRGIGWGGGWIGREGYSKGLVVIGRD